MIFGGIASAQYAPSVVSVHGSMTTRADIIDRFVFRVPAQTTDLTIRVPIPANSAPSSEFPQASPLEDAPRVGAVSVTSTAQPDSETNVRDQAGNLYRVLTYNHLAPQTITVSSVLHGVRTKADLDTPLPSTPYPLQWMPPSAQHYLRPTRLVQSDDMRIVMLARSIVGGCRTESDASQALVEWLQKRVGYSLNAATINRTDAMSTLTRGGGVCEGWAHLFLALARASGIPARYVGGYSIGGEITYPMTTGLSSSVSVIMPSNLHAWVELWYPGAGWVPYDPQTSAGFVDTHHVPIWTGLDGNSEYPILSWEMAEGADSACSYAEQESTSNISDYNQLHCDTEDVLRNGGGGLLLCR